VDYPERCDFFLLFAFIGIRHVNHRTDIHLNILMIMSILLNYIYYISNIIDYIAYKY